ncbi:DUF3455 domain-containing protein [Kibdelosporangium philippinense]|uniref:DUF3455 domain-containing protein n=1 Tax=Kibdelosporangium philippinense TaxID=211113 RepID=A0ABS8ZR06_9PSEU|nr:DUF3455 domain-containing protein [Kibdelosporangium philippinense]MCE7010171.1 DUF3455 domain-containing protein [Kibdelosporangium philippinense]
MRARNIMVGLAVAAFTTLGIGASASATPKVPDALQVPAGNKLILLSPARGVQTYQCTGDALTFVQPDAILTHRGQLEILHTKGPVWTSVADGSSVTGAVVASSPVPNAIPQLLLRSVGNRGPGKLADVTVIQRLKTTGGLAPTGPCTEGATASVPYTADYAFYVAQ